MPTLFAFPFACSMAVHVSLAQHNIPTTLVWVPRGPARKVADIRLAALNPKRKVPTLILDDEVVRTEIIAILHHLDALHAGLDATQRRESLEWLGFLATELHHGVLGPAFDPASPQPARDDVLQRILPPVLQTLESHLNFRDTLLGTSTTTTADAYLFWAVLLLQNAVPDAVRTPGIQAHSQRMLRHEFVARVMQQNRSALSAA